MRKQYKQERTYFFLVAESLDAMVLLGSISNFIRLEKLKDDFEAFSVDIGGLFPIKIVCFGKNILIVCKNQ